MVSPVQKGIPGHFRFLYLEASEVPTDAYAVFEGCRNDRYGVHYSLHFLISRVRQRPTQISISRPSFVL